MGTLTCTFSAAFASCRGESASSPMAGAARVAICSWVTRVASVSMLMSWDSWALSVGSTSTSACGDVEGGAAVYESQGKDCDEDSYQADRPLAATEDIREFAKVEQPHLICGWLLHHSRPPRDLQGRDVCSRRNLIDGRRCRDCPSREVDRDPRRLPGHPSLRAAFLSADQGLW